MRTLPLLMTVVVSLLLGPAARAQQVSWSGTDLSGAAVKVPVDRPSIMAFVRAQQDQSAAALEQIKAIVTDAAATQVVVILSGPQAADQARQMSGTLPPAWKVVADADFVASGKMNVHVWPTTLVIKSDGTESAHLAGMPRSFPTDLKAQLEFAAGKINQQALAQRLAARDVVSDSPAQAAARHLLVAQRFIDQGQLDQAQAQITLGLALAPSDPMLLLAAARVAVLMNKPQAAIELLDKLPADSVPGAQKTLVRARALMAMDKWPDAKSILPEAIKLNPNPAEGHYLLGLCHQHDREFERAAEQFRLAYEKSPGSAAMK